MLAVHRTRGALAFFSVAVALTTTSGQSDVPCCLVPGGWYGSLLTTACGQACESLGAGAGGGGGGGWTINVLRPKHAGAVGRFRQRKSL